MSYFMDCVLGALKLKYLFMSQEKYNVEFTPEERKKAIELLIETGVKDRLDDVIFYWNSLMGKDAIGCFSPLTMNSIYITSSFKFGCNSDGFKKLIAPMAHELKHREQYCHLNILYFIFCIPILRNFTIEVEAQQVTTEVNKFFNIPENDWL